MKKLPSDVKQVITANLKLITTSEKENLLHEVTFSDHSCLKFTSWLAFENGKLSSDIQLQKHSNFIKLNKEVPQKRSYNRYTKTTPNQQAITCIQHRLMGLFGRNQQLIVDINDHITKQIVTCTNFIKLKNLILYLRIFPRHISKKIYNNRVQKTGNEKQYCHLYPVFYYLKRRKANISQSKWSYAELDGFIHYKVVMNNSSTIRVDANHCSQSCPFCGHINRHNCPNQGLMICCSRSRGFESCADLVGGRYVAMKTLVTLASRL
ncbi:hypothetical protein BZZ01_28915 [Nostocales cyanobacterium HT-58-2]|nr:hypothetical protein BZZ01_28915 [Nostocales cyanobacterium HT-58-2]